MAQILLIDDDWEFGELLRERLVAEKFQVDYLEEAEEALGRLAGGAAYDAVLVDNRMPGMSGVEFLEELRKREIHIPAILMTSVLKHHDEVGIKAGKLGAADYIIKPLEVDAVLDELLPALESALRRPPRPVPIPSPARPDATPGRSGIIGTSSAMRKVLTRIGLLAGKLGVPVLILGETGTGKDLVARAIHTNSRRKGQNFVVVNCGALHENLLASELFGHVPGAFSDAKGLRKGLFEHADGGTIFLDEVGEMPLSLQVHLLRVLENREVLRVGSNEPVPVDVQVISATHRDLAAAVARGAFREDLYHRLHGAVIKLPPLRERKEDIPDLVQAFLAQGEGGGPRPVLHPAALQVLMDCDWPGNVRQLKNVLREASYFCRDGQILPEDIETGEAARAAPAPAAGAVTPPPVPAGVTVEDHLQALAAWAWTTGQGWPAVRDKLEEALLRFALAQPGSSQVQMARRLGMARNTLRARLEQYKLTAPESPET